MADDKNVYSANDPLDINELAALNDDITPEFIEQLQNQVSQTANILNNKNTEKSDTELFEEVTEKQEEKVEVKHVKVDIDSNIDDNFIKKYKAKLNKQQNELSAKDADTELKSRAQKSNLENKGSSIENISSGNIVEKPITEEQKNYNDSLDFLDNNVKYSKYVIYIDPENTDFIESLTVKERKNLINRILREQDDIAITKRRLGMIHTIIKHTIIAVLTVSIAIPIMYFTINASLEATIDNYRRSQTIFKTLYRENGKIKNILKWVLTSLFLAQNSVSNYRAQLITHDRGWYK